MEQTCSICYDPYNTTNRIPRIIPICGHTLCSECLSKLIQQPGELKCPFDKKIIPFPERPQKVEVFPENYALKHLLGQEKKLCPIHGDELRFVCMTDKVKLCDSCMCESKHQGHAIVPLKKIEQKATSAKSEVERILRELDHLRSEVTKILDDNQKRQIIIVRELFGEFRRLIYQKELDLCFQINYFYDLEKDRVNEIIGNDSTFRNEIMSRKSELEDASQKDDFLQDGQFFENIHKEAQNWMSKVKPDQIKEDIKGIEIKLEKMFSEFHSGFLTYVESCCNISFSFPDSVDCIVQTFSKDVQFYAHPKIPFKNMPENYLNFSMQEKIKYFKVKLDANMAPFYIRSRFNFEVTLNLASSKVLNIKTCTESRLTTIDLEEWTKVQIVKLEFKEGHHIDDKDITALSYVWRRLIGPSSLQIKIDQNSIVNCYKDVCTALLDGSNGFTSVVIDMAGYQLANRNLVKYLIDDLLSKMTHLKDIRLIMNDINLRSRSQGALFQGMVLNSANLQYFSLKLTNSNILDEDIASIFVSMPNIKKYFLDFEATKVTDASLELYAKNTLPHMKYLEIYVLNLNYTRVTDTGLRGLFVNPIAVKQFQFFIAGTQATDPTVLCLLESIKHSLNKFEIFSINFSYCKITDQVICQMFQEMNKVKTYTLGLSNTQVTDRTLLLFAKSSLATMKSLENFAISLDETNVTDVGVNHIISELVLNLKQLVLSLHHTAVTNKSIEPFVRTRLTAMKSLKGFKMNVTETSVSQEIKAEIERIEKAVKEKAA